MWNRNGNGNGNAAMMMMNVVRHFSSSSSRKRAPNLRKINPRVPYQAAAAIAEDLYGVIKSHGPLTVSTTWNHIKEAGISGVDSKTHLKLLLKWMRGRSMLKQICNHVGSAKKFMLTTLPEDPNQSNSSIELKQTTEKPSRSNKRRSH